MFQRKKKYIGLSNQENTCYMNSIIQTLYMTPEFRYCIYNYQYDSENHGDRLDSVLFQLQLLFAKLQISNFSYATTECIKASFNLITRNISNIMIYKNFTT